MIKKNNFMYDLDGLNLFKKRWYGINKCLLDQKYKFCIMSIKILRRFDERVYMRALISYFDFISRRLGMIYANIVLIFKHCIL